MDVEKVPVACEKYPKAVAPLVVACVPLPKAVEKSPLAVVSLPAENEESPLAVVASPRATDILPVDVFADPIAIEASPSAVIDPVEPIITELFPTPFFIGPSVSVVEDPAPDHIEIVPPVPVPTLGDGIFKTPLTKVDNPEPVVVRLVKGITGVGIFNTPTIKVAAEPEDPAVVKLVTEPPPTLSSMSCIVKTFLSEFA